MRKFCTLMISALLVLLLCACSSHGDDESNSDNDAYEERLSESCDAVLCTAVDDSGNEYELVANQKEDSSGYEITVGVIKNNEWVYPMSADFPFLGENGLFYLSTDILLEPGSDLSRAAAISDAIGFIKPNIFVMDSSKYSTMVSTEFDRKIFFNCDTLKSCTIDLKEYTIMEYPSKEYSSFADGEIYFYRVAADDGKALMYKEITGTHSGWLEDQVFDWCLLDLQTLEIETFKSGVSGIQPASYLAEGLFFATDQGFYDTNGNKVVDLSNYTIDMYSDGRIYFENGKCTFKAENSLGTEFLITIDKTGKVLSEEKQ